MNPTYDNVKALIGGIKDRFDNNTTYTQFDTVTILEMLNARLDMIENRQMCVGETTKKAEPEFKKMSFQETLLRTNSFLGHPLEYWAKLEQTLKENGKEQIVLENAKLRRLLTQNHTRYIDTLHEIKELLIKGSDVRIVNIIDNILDDPVF